MKTLVEHLSQLIKEYLDLGIEDTLNYTKFNEYSLTYHSTAIEGATLTQVQPELLLNEGIVPQGKPLEHINMEQDHFLNKKSPKFSLRLWKIN